MQPNKQPFGTDQNRQPEPPARQARDQIESLLEGGNVRDAANAMRRSSMPESEAASLLNTWGRRYMAEQRFDSAVQAFQILADASPRDFRAHNGLAVACQMAGYGDMALAEMKLTVRLAPKPAVHLLNLAKLHALREEWQEASDVLDRALPELAGPHLQEVEQVRDLIASKLAQQEEPEMWTWSPRDSPSPREGLEFLGEAQEPSAEGGGSQNIGEPAPAAWDPLPLAGQPPRGQAGPQADKAAAGEDGPLNILFVQEAPCIRNYKMAQALGALGHKVSLAYTRATLSQMYPGLSDDVYQRLIRITDHRKLWDVAQEFDLVHCHNEPDVLSVAALGCGKPVVHDTHDLISLRAHGDANLAFFEGLANRAATGRVYSTAYQRDEAAELYGVVGPSLVFMNYASRPDLPQKLLPKLSQRDGQTHLVYEGGIGGTAHRDFLDLFTELARGGVQLHVYPARHDSQLADWFQRQTNLHYHQPVSPKEIMREMSRYDAGVIPFNLAKGNKRFLDSTIANKLFEYLAAGLPVVASDLKSYRDYFAANPVGFTFAGARDILDNLGRLAEISAGADLTRYGLTYEGEISRMVGFYREVLAGSAAQARSVASPA